MDEVKIVNEKCDILRGEFCQIEKRQNTMEKKLQEKSDELLILKTESKSTNNIVIENKHMLMEMKKTMLTLVLTISSGIFITVVGGLILYALTKKP